MSATPKDINHESSPYDFCKILSGDANPIVIDVKPFVVSILLFCINVKTFTPFNLIQYQELILEAL